jgi:hypothetical protein
VPGGSASFEMTRGGSVVEVTEFVDMATPTPTPLATPTPLFVQSANLSPSQIAPESLPFEESATLSLSGRSKFADARHLGRS